MPSSATPASGDDSEVQLTSSVLGLAAFTPLPDQLGDIREYLAGVEAAVSALPVCDPVADALEIGFDPGWPEEEA